METGIQNDLVRPVKKDRLGLIAVLYVLGLFIGALNTGIITPARTIIQGSLGANDVTGIWMINIYTLAYAAAIPIAGKLADKLGRKYIYITSILLFGLGSLACGISSATGSFGLLLAGRVIQALGGGGIMPIATAEFGTSFPKEKQGMALGIIGGVYGIANILGSTAGSLILNMAGNDNWKWLFYINIPICLIIMIFSFIFLPNHRASEVKKIDKLGTLVIVAMILSLLYGLKGIDFFDFGATVASTAVYPYLIAFVLMLPLFIFIEKKAEDPVLNLSYFSNRQIVVTFILSLIVGLSMMGMVFVPQFAENTLKMPTGTGGYFVAVLGIFAGIAAPVSGNLIDRIGVKKVLGAGFAISTIGALFLIFVAIPHSSFFTVCISLLLIGLGMGFTMGTPLNYMILQHTRSEESNSALASVSLIRSIGTAISPAIMIGFIAQAGILVQDNLMNMLPQPTAPKIEQAQELTDYFNRMKSNPKFAEMMKNVVIPDFSKMGEMKFDMSGDGKLPEDVLKSFQTADVTNITDRTRTFAARMFDENTPPVIGKIQNGIQTGMDKMKEGLAGMETAEADMKKGADGMDKGIAEMTAGYDGIAAGMSKMQDAVDKQAMAISQMTKVYEAMKNGAAPSGAMPSGDMPSGAMPSGDMPSASTNADEDTVSRAGMPSAPGSGISADAKSGMSMEPDKLKLQISQLTAAKNQLMAKLNEMAVQKEEMGKAIQDTKTKKEQLLTGIAQMDIQKASLSSAIDKMAAMKASIPAAFEQAKKDYLDKLEVMRPDLEGTFKDTLNNGFRMMYIFVAAANALALVVLLFYSPGNRKKVPAEK